MLAVRVALDVVILEERLSSPMSGKVWTWPGFLVPKLDPEAYFTTEEYEFRPQFEGVCEISLESEAFKRKEVTTSGSMQKTSERNRISSSFSVVRWQELEIIQLLRKLVLKVVTPESNVLSPSIESCR